LRVITRNSRNATLDSRLQQVAISGPQTTFGPLQFPGNIVSVLRPRFAFISIRRYGLPLSAEFSKHPPSQIHCPPLA